MKFLIKIFLIICFFIPEKSFSSAWIQDEGKTQVISQLWNLKSSLHGNKYNQLGLPMYLRQHSINLYAEHGLTKRISIGMNSLASWKQVEDRQSGMNSEKKVFEFIELFAKFNLIKTDIIVLTTQFLTKIPGYKEYQLHYSLSPDRPYRSYEGRIMLGIGSGNGGLLSGILLDNGSFLNFEIGYRRNENFVRYDEIRSEIDYGFRVEDDNLKMVLIQFFRVNKIYTLLYNGMQNGYTHNDMTNMMISCLFDIGNKTLLQFGIINEIKGKLIGRSEEGNNTKGLIIGIWF